MTILQALILSIIEGITEFLPISSTGHMIIASHYMNIEDQALLKSFEIIIQFGAILSVVLIYKNKFFKVNYSFYKKLIFAFLPTGIIGFLLKNKVDQWLDSIHIVAWALIVGGIILISCDFIFKTKNLKKRIESLSLIESSYLGIFQSMALIPGISRSGATIVGGLVLNLTKKEAAEFSFFLAVPTMTATTLYKSIKILPQITPEQFGIIGLGSVIAFVIAFLAVKSFIQIVSKYGFLYFGVYRIILGLLILFIG